MRNLSALLVCSVIVGGLMFVAGIFIGTNHVVSGCDMNGQFRLGQLVYRCQSDGFTR